MLRQVIVTVMGNVDAGKSQIIDIIKRTSIVKSEPGKITQSIKAYSASISAIKKICKDLLDTSKIKVPGLLFLDTPGHKAFSNLRKRGGSLADIAIVVIDVNEGIKPQTLESLEILKETKTPFVIALNKVDLVPGWHSSPEKNILKNINEQNESTRRLLDDKLYNLVASLYELNMNAERFDRVSDYTKQVAIIPTGAKTAEGVPELLMVLTGLAQKFLESMLQYDENGPAKGTILEVIEEKGLGTTIDVIVYDGKIKVGDQIVLGGLQKPFVTKVKALLLAEGNKFKQLKEAKAAIGVKIAAPGMNDVIPGMPMRVANKDLEKAKDAIMEEVEELTLELDDHGIILKADSLGSLEGLISLLREKEITIKRASIGNVSKKDVAEALSEVDPVNRVILAFNVKGLTGSPAKIFEGDVIYTIIDKFEEWREKELKAAEASQLKNLVWPAKFRILPGYIFRQNNPCIVGVEVLAGKVKTGMPVLKEKRITSIKGIQHEGKSTDEATKGQSVAVSLPNVTINRQIKEGDILYSDIPEPDFKLFKKLKKYLNEDEVQVMKEIAEIKRKEFPGWGR